MNNYILYNDFFTREYKCWHIIDFGDSYSWKVLNSVAKGINGKNDSPIDTLKQYDYTWAIQYEE